MTTFDFIPYMQKLAEELPEIGHVASDKRRCAFYRTKSILNVDELTQNLTAAPDVVMVIEDSRMGRKYAYATSQNIRRRSYTFAILKRQPKTNSLALDEAALDAVEAIVKKIESRINHDSFYDQTNPGSDINGLRDLVSAEGYSETDFTLGPGSFIGIIVSFAIEDKAGLVYNASDWEPAS